MSYFQLIDLKSIIFLILLISFNINIIIFRNKISKLLNIFDYPDERKIHTIPTPLVGGICILFSILFASIIIVFNGQPFEKKLIVFLLFNLIFFVVGLWDDSKTLTPKIKTFVILISTIILIPIESNFIIKELVFKSTDIIITFESFSIFFSIFCIFALYNALNFIDGYNGVASSIIIYWTLYLFLKNPNLIYLYLFVTMTIIFLKNLEGKIFIGNSGSSLLSVFFSLSIINDYNINENLFADEIFFILLFPGIDMIRVTFERLKDRKKIYYPDKRHFHHYLIKLKIKYIWQIMLILTLLPMCLFELLGSIILSTLIFIVLYFVILTYFYKNNGQA